MTRQSGQYLNYSRLGGEGLYVLVKGNDVSIVRLGQGHQKGIVDLLVPVAALERGSPQITTQLGIGEK